MSNITKETSAEQIAEELYNKMEGLKCKEDSKHDWVHSPKEFLPANVVCDAAGMMNFKRWMADIIRPFLT